MQAFPEGHDDRVGQGNLMAVAPRLVCICNEHASRAGCQNRLDPAGGVV